MTQPEVWLICIFGRSSSPCIAAAGPPAEAVECGSERRNYLCATWEWEEGLGGGTSVWSLQTIHPVVTAIGGTMEAEADLLPSTCTQFMAIMPLLLHSNEYQVNQITLGLQFQEKCIRNHGPPEKHERICMHVTEKTNKYIFYISTVCSLLKI